MKPELIMFANKIDTIIGWCPVQRSWLMLRWSGVDNGWRADHEDAYSYPFEVLHPTHFVPLADYSSESMAEIFNFPMVKARNRT